MLARYAIPQKVFTIANVHGKKTVVKPLLFSLSIIFVRLALSAIIILLYLNI
jgi:hypothetical protein